MGIQSRHPSRQRKKKEVNDSYGSRKLALRNKLIRIILTFVAASRNPVEKVLRGKRETDRWRERGKDGGGHAALSPRYELYTRNDHRYYARGEGPRKLNGSLAVSNWPRFARVIPMVVTRV